MRYTYPNRDPNSYWKSTPVRKAIQKLP
jgi:hypothetical protein